MENVTISTSSENGSTSTVVNEDVAIAVGANSSDI